MDNAPLILIIEDERPIRNFLRSALATQSYRVLETERGRDGLALAASHVPDVILLDLGLPDRDGLEVIKELRAWFTGPILILSAREQERDKIAALDAGADDYLTKPFGVGELLARIRVALRKQARTAKEGGKEVTVFTVGGLKVDLEARRVFIDGEEIHLTPIEYKLLTVLVKNAGKVLTHSHLLREVWGPGNADQLHYVRIYMAGLRKKLEKDPARPRYLFTEVGVGYRLADE
jgi:two-component system KDP operon response regulator KdpE